ncbi:hypothetical protein [Hyunsoonleella pacifica]|uniref:Uncharacterized protein n=1 Tax=Hyunsoonleella pacifica TaxID=1080224 RepID=A0A4Q9FMI5_9FLAO|nr:hypothetical protein [Hyunsoonleella pacifica]TBN15420.1 hypothetical protein EYD46_09785 [Hyunsoonleella pacifica]GGD23943.1 hypothetical protein GCM10011368_27480 [Hyunsoonleella pacifica]
MKNKNLHSTKTTGFKTPEGYFDDLDEKLLQYIKSDDLSVDKIPSGFKVPEHYFEGIEDNIITAVSKEKDTKVIPLFSKKNIRYVSSIAASVLLLISLFIFNNKPEFDDLETQTVENYIIDANISSYEIASLLSEDDINEHTFITNDIEDETIEAYLLDTGDFESLMIE